VQKKVEGTSFLASRLLTAQVTTCIVSTAEAMVCGGDIFLVFALFVQHLIGSQLLFNQSDPQSCI